LSSNETGDSLAEHWVVIHRQNANRVRRCTHDFVYLLLAVGQNLATAGLV
jgi:hypothetical protein